ncbi:MAG: DUF2911 domain-containing protein [Bacteroidia bacterium]
MLKKVLIVVGVVVVLIAGAMYYLNNRNRTLSPPQEEVWQGGEGTEFMVKYSAPSVRNRIIFGTVEEGALQPFGKYWRLGANESTEINFTGSYFVEGNELKEGTYKVYCYPGADEFTFCFAPADGAWGAWEPEKEAELFKVQIPVNRLEVPVEQFAITLVPEAAEKGIEMICEFSDYQLIVPFKK